MNNLDNSRKEIEQIDKEIAKLFEKRMAISEKIALYKKENNLPIYDEKREMNLIAKNSEYIENEIIKKYYVTFLKELMNISKQYQEQIMED